MFLEERQSLVSGIRVEKAPAERYLCLTQRRIQVKRRFELFRRVVVLAKPLQADTGIVCERSVEGLHFADRAVDVEGFLEPPRLEVCQGIFPKALCVWLLQRRAGRERLRFGF